MKEDRRKKKEERRKKREERTKNKERRKKEERKKKNPSISTMSVTQSVRNYAQRYYRYY